MTHADCAREREIHRAVLERGWPGSCAEEWQAHARTCAVCADVAALAALFAEARREGLRDVRVPAAGQVWWRAALRAHAESTRAARRPMIWLQGLAGACAAGIGAALVSFAWPAITGAAAGIAQSVSRLDVSVSTLAPILEMLQPVLLPTLAAVACLVVAPIAVYLALSDE